MNAACRGEDLTSSTGRSRNTGECLVPSLVELASVRWYKGGLRGSSKREKGLSWPASVIVTLGERMGHFALEVAR